MDPQHSQEHFARHGGVHFQSNRPTQEINEFVRRLPDEKRESSLQLLQQLNRAGFITLYNDEVWTDGEGERGGSDDC